MLEGSEIEIALLRSIHGQSVTESIIDGNIEDQEKKEARSKEQEAGSEEQWHSAPAHGL